MEIIDAILSLTMLLLMLGSTSMLFTALGWLVGWFSWSENRRPPLVTLMKTPPLRWSAWGLGSLGAIIGIALIGNGSLLPGVLIFVLGAFAAQAAAFSMGFAVRDRRFAHNNDHLYAALPEGLGPQHLTTSPALLTDTTLDMGENVQAKTYWEDREPEVDRAAIMSSAPSALSTGTPDYPMAQPQDD